MQASERTKSAVATDIHNAGGTRVLVLRNDGQTADIKSLVHELITEAWAQQATTIAIPIDCLPVEFFQLRSGAAVAMTQKLVNYRITVAFVGTIADHFLESQTFGDFIRDCNRGRSTWFVEDMNALSRRLDGRNR